MAKERCPVCGDLCDLEVGECPTCGCDLDSISDKKCPRCGSRNFTRHDNRLVCNSCNHRWTEILE